jgi:hypothetical protein
VAGPAGLRVQGRDSLKVESIFFPLKSLPVLLGSMHSEREYAMDFVDMGISRPAEAGLEILPETLFRNARDGLTVSIGYWKPLESFAGRKWVQIAALLRCSTPIGTVQMAFYFLLGL